ncbi:MAG TPA: HDOD domain-containing protein [Oligoflexus sp.]|uniref:HDOD domain-containing protein n=1 Tax=Oligoflexus sp. TaxID=1971216 RepID=UPI002D48F6E0|nr:HDOD domain-containing protein [Oligoflexus sp.]HYX35514.1 HDOD domain-containing protein [Oligoflexus sp.]
MEANEHPIMDCNNCGRLFFSTEDFLAHTSRWRVCSAGHLWFNCACESTNVIKKGSHEWYNPFSKLSPQAQSIFNQIPNLQTLPRLPMSVMELLQKIDDQNASSHELAALARNDPLLSAKILRIAENQTMNYRAKPKSLSHAISLVGRYHVKEIVLLAAISSVEAKTRVFHSDEFWDHSMAIGRIAEHLAKKFKTELADDEAYITGCLCNLGKLVLALCRPDIADRFQVEVNDIHTMGPWTTAEQRHAGFQHTVMGEIGGALWGLSESSINAIRGHHSIGTTNDPTPNELIGLANQFAHWIWLQPHQIDREYFGQLLPRFHLTPADAEQLAEELMPLAIQERAG